MRARRCEGFSIGSTMCWWEVGPPTWWRRGRTRATIGRISQGAHDSWKTRWPELSDSRSQGHRHIVQASAGSSARCTDRERSDGSLCGLAFPWGGNALAHRKGKQIRGPRIHLGKNMETAVSRTLLRASSSLRLSTCAPPYACVSPKKSVIAHTWSPIELPTRGLGETSGTRPEHGVRNVFGDLRRSALRQSAAMFSRSLRSSAR